MSFLKRHNKLIQSALSLQTHFKKHTDKYDLIFPKIKNKISNYFSKRISSVISFTSEGSLTIEAALIIPIFLFAVMAVLSFTEVLCLQMKIDSSMQQCAKELAVYGYAAKECGGEKMDELPLGAETLFSEIYVRNRIISETGEDYLKESPMESTNALHLAGSRIMENDRIELRCTYYVTPFFALSPKAGFLMESTAVARAFTGYDNLAAAPPEENEEYVYVTENGTAYHRDRGCHYLDLSIEKVFTKELPLLRNADGSIYGACPICGDTNSGSVAFITKYGNKYHSDILCSGLRRTIKRIPISQIGNRTPCKKCG